MGSARVNTRATTADAKDHACLMNGSVMEWKVAQMGVMSQRILVLSGADQATMEQNGTGRKIF